MREKIKDPEPIIEFLSQEIDFQNLKYRMEILRAIKQWALDQLGIKVGDRVMIKDYTPTPGDGWWSHRESLINGAYAEVKDIDFSPRHNKWYADIILEKEWTVHEWGVNELRRYDRKGDKKHTFMFWVRQLEKINDETKVT